MKLFNGVKVERKKILDYFNEYYMSALIIYNRYKRFGFPWSGGWAEQPDYIMSIIELFDYTMDQFNVYKAEKARKARKK